MRTESSRSHGAPDEIVTMEDFFKDQRKRSNSTPNEIEKKANGFERIKGIIRRGSAGLGLKINNEPDVADLSYVAEHQENLNVIQVMVHGAGVSAQSDLSIETDEQASDLATLVSKTSTSRITLPTAAVAGQTVPLVLHNLHLEAKLASIPTSLSAPVSSLNTVITQALSASDLRRLQPKSLCCSSCDREIAELPPTGAYKDLPSEHWAEMLEVWMCHSDPGFTAGISAKAKDGFWPANGTVLVGGSYLLLEPEYVKPHNLVVDDQAVSPLHPLALSPFLSPTRSLQRTTRRSSSITNWRSLPFCHTPLRRKLLASSRSSAGGMVEGRDRERSPTYPSRRWERFLWLIHRSHMNVYVLHVP